MSSLDDRAITQGRIQLGAQGHVPPQTSIKRDIQLPKSVKTGVKLQKKMSMKCSKIAFGAEGAYDAPPDPLVSWGGVYSSPMCPPTNFLYPPLLLPGFCQRVKMSPSVFGLWTQT